MDEVTAARDAELRAARDAVYRPGATDEDRSRYRALVARADRDRAALRTGAERRTAPRVAAGGHRRVAIRLAVPAAVVAVVVAAALVGSAQPEPRVAPSAAATSSSALDLRAVPAGWRLSSLVSRGDRIGSASTLSLFRSVTGGEFLLVVRCPAADRRFRVALSDADGRIGAPRSGACGRQVAVALGLERGVGRVDLQLTTAGDLPFSAAIVRRGSGGGRGAPGSDPDAG